MKNILLLLLSISMWQAVAAQDDLSGFFLHDTYQRTHYNPAFYDDKKVSISIYNATGNIYSTAANILGQAEQDALGNITIDRNSIARDASSTYGFVDVGLLEASVRVADDWYISGGFQQHISLFNHTMRDFVNLALDGNAPYVGETLELDPRFALTSHNEFYLGVAHKVGKLDVGVRVGLLSGISDISTGSDQLRLTTDEEFYQLNFDNDYVINTTADVTYNGLDDAEAEINLRDGLLSSNLGFSMDLGVAYQVSDKLQVSASILDLGSIRWSSSPKNFTSKGTFSYDGVDISDYIDDSTLELELADSLGDLLQVVETNDSYATALPTRLLLGADYHINDKWRCGAVVAMRRYKGHTSLALGLQTSRRILRVLDVGVQYSYRAGNPLNIGLSTTLFLGPVQFILAADNIFGFDVTGSSHAHIRTGLGLRFGK